MPIRMYRLSAFLPFHIGILLVHYCSENRKANS